MNFSSYVGWDIGGAHLKVASIDQSGRLEYVKQFATPLWQGLEHLEDKFPVILDELSAGTKSHGLTMTAELADIFVDRNEGVNKLIGICRERLGDDIQLYAGQSGFVKTEEALAKPGQIASANWCASAEFAAARYSTGIFVDIGSTTTDIIPFLNHSLINRGTDDQSRLHFDELVYSGVIRTPLMSVTDRVPFKGEWQAIVAECFATTADVYRILGMIDEVDDLLQSADGKPKDIDNSIKRLARMLGTDASAHDELSVWNQLAFYFAERQIQRISNAVSRVMGYAPELRQRIVGAGVGSFLIKKIAARLGVPYQSFSELISHDRQFEYQCNVCAPAVALAMLNQRDAMT